MNIYSFPTFNLTKILLTAEETGEAYKLNLLDITQGEHKSEQHLIRHPLGKVPAVEIEGNNYFESNAICRFIAERNNNKLYGETAEQRALINQWVDMATLHIGRWLTVMFFERKIKRVFFNGETDEKNVAEAETFLSQQLPAFESQLNQHNFIAGSEYSIADIIAYSYFSTVPHSGLDLSTYPKIREWISCVEARPSFKKAMSHLPDNDIFSILNK